MTKWKSNKDKVRGNIAAGGWDVSYGREVTSLDLVVGALSTVTGGVGTAAWVEDHWFKLGIGGWQRSAPSFQPFIGFRLAKRLATAGVLELAETEPPVLLATALLDMEESEPEPPPSPIATHEDIHWVYGKEEPLPSIVMAG